LWHASVIGLSLDEFKHALAQGSKLQKVLVNHLYADSVQRVSRGRKVEIISIEICYTDQTIKALKKIKVFPILLVLPNHAVGSARFIVEQLQKWTKCKEEKISWMLVDEVKDFRHLLNNPQYERILVSPGARGKVPAELRHNSRILLLQMELDPEDLEIARIRAGVIV
jgi:hypothetical protein